MEDPCLAVVEEDEDFYERIEAPKFVDFTIPDSSRQDHRSWFCARIGCDQNHEEVDPNEINRSFMLRVMAARSPNVRFQRVLSKQGSRANTKCPQSAPAKSIKNGISRITALNSTVEKITMAKLKQHPIASLRETPIHRRAKLQTLAGENEPTTTGNKKSQAKYLKTSGAAVASKDRNLAKPLFSHTPKKAAGSSKAPISEICSEKRKKINLNGERKRMTRGSKHAMSSNKSKGSSISSKKTSEGSKHRNHIILKEAKHNEMRDVNQICVVSEGSDHVEAKNAHLVKPTGEEYRAVVDSKIESDSEVLIRPSKADVQNIGLKVFTGADSEIKTACNAMNEDDKENTLFTFENKNMHTNAATSEVKSSRFDNSNLQEAKVQNKALQGVKLTRTTNPKPFRLRTDERGILKEANLERKLQVEYKKQSATLLKHVDGIQERGILKEANLEMKLQVESKKQPATLLKHVDAIQERGILKEANLERKLQVESKKQPATLLKHVDGIQIQETDSQAKLAKSTQTYMLNSKKEKIMQGSQHCKSLKIASTKQLLKITSAAKERRESISRMFKGGLIKLHDNRTSGRRAGYLQLKKPATIPKEPKFHRIHVPKNCIRRFEMAVS